jgi:hypothetical protein
VPNTLSTITVPSPVYTQTITPPRSAVTQVSTSTQTFTRWSQVDTSTATVVTPTCRTPLRPLHPDPICTVFPNKLQIPVGVTGVQRRALTFGEAAPAPTPSSSSSSSSLSSHSVAEHVTAGRPGDKVPYYLTVSRPSQGTRNKMNNPYHTGPEGEQTKLQKRDPDASAITVTDTTDTTATVTASPASTQTDFEASTSTFYVMDAAPQTVFVGQPVQTVMAAVQPVETVVQTAFVRAHETQTFGLTWTQTLSSTPSAALESCRAIGGNFGKWW